MWDAVPDKALQANELAMLNNIGDISGDYLDAYLEYGTY